MRTALTVLHRYVGLAIAVFVALSGITGAIIAWDHELDALLNPVLMRTARIGTPISPVELAHDLEKRDPRLQVTYLPTAPEAGKTLSMFVAPRIDRETGRAFALDFNELFFDPVTGRELGRREWGRTWPIDRATLIPFLYKLHYSLHIPSVGMWLMGSVAAIWFFDCFVGFCLTLPRRHRISQSPQTRGWWTRWAHAWRIKTGGSRYRVVFDIHRAFGLWTWALLLVVSFSGFALALNAEILRPVLSTMAQVTPTPLDAQPIARAKPPAPRLNILDIASLARTEGDKRHIEPPLAAISYDPAHEVYSAMYFVPGGHGGKGGVEPDTLYFDGRDGKVLGATRPWSGTSADLFLQAQFPVHSGRILGLFGRVLVTFVGLAVAALSLSGVLIWWRKRTARRLSERKRVAAASFAR